MNTFRIVFEKLVEDEENWNEYIMKKEVKEKEENVIDACNKALRKLKSEGFPFSEEDIVLVE